MSDSTFEPHICVESPNPRVHGFCACGKRLPTSSRNSEYEHTFLAEAAKQAEKRFGLPTDGFPRAVEHRLEMGQELYGDEYLTKELGREIAEEAWDSAAYSVLEAQKRLAVGEDDAAAWRLWEITIYSAAIAHHASMLGRDD